MNIQRLDIDDWRRLKPLRLAALKDAPEAFDTTHDDVAKFGEADWRRQLAELTTFVAVDNGKDLGMVRGVTSEADQRTAFLISMWVAPQARGLKVGEKLIHAVLNWARQSGYTRIELDVADNNTSAIALYERCGFLPTGETGRLSPPRSHVLEHRRALKL